MITLIETSAFAKNRKQLTGLPHDKDRILLSVDKEEKKLYCLILSEEKLVFENFEVSLTDRDIHKMVITCSKSSKGSDANISTFDLDLEGDTSKRKLLEVELKVLESTAEELSFAVLSSTQNTNPPPPKSSVYYGDADA